MKAGDCRHFNGLQHATCEAGVPYADVKDPVARPLRLPCLPNVRWSTSTTCTTTCSKFGAVSQAEEDAFIAEMDEARRTRLRPGALAVLQGSPRRRDDDVLLEVQGARRSRRPPRRRLVTSSERLLCDDCGQEPKWRWAALCGGCDSYCKRCNSKAGYRTTFDVDPDLLVKFLEGTGGELVVDDPAAVAKMILDACHPRNSP